MWIAKPLAALPAEERAAWGRVRAPLSQSLAWGEAIRALGGRAYLVMSTDEGVGGMVHEASDSGGHFECTNGPVLDWDDAVKATRQLATFALAVSKLSRGFRTMVLRPRWEAARLEVRLAALPVEARNVARAATIQLDVAPTRAAQLAGVSPRLRRTLAATERAGVRVREERPTPDALALFAREMREFGAARDFFVPEAPWFAALSNGLELHLVTAEAGARASRLLVARAGEQAFYLFGMDRHAARGASALSTAACAQFRVLEMCSALGVRVYDLQGYVGANRPGHAYAGVSRFKEQFGGRVVEYACPEFCIS